MKKNSLILLIGIEKILIKNPKYFENSLSSLMFTCRDEISKIGLVRNITWSAYGIQ